MEEDFLLESRRDGIQNLNHNRAGVTQKAAAGPEQAGIQRDGQHGHAFGRIKIGDAVFVARLRSDRPACAFGKNDQLTPPGEFDSGTLRHIGECLRTFAAVHRDHPPFDREPAENRDPLQFPLHDKRRAGKQV